MKYLLIITCFLFVTLAHGQIGYKQLLLSGGLSLSNSKLLTVQYEGAGVHKIHAGVLLQTIWYSNDENAHYSLKSNTIYGAAGLYLKGDMHTSKNFSATWHLGGACGTNTHEVIIYPFGGLDQGWYICPKTQLFVSENVIYVVISSIMNTWKPYIGAGLKFSL